MPGSSTWTLKYSAHDEAPASGGAETSAAWHPPPLTGRCQQVSSHVTVFYKYQRFLNTSGLFERWKWEEVVFKRVLLKMIAQHVSLTLWRCS